MENNKNKDLPIGYIGNIGKKWFKVVEGNNCENCIFDKCCNDDLVELIGHCIDGTREDATTIFYKEIHFPDHIPDAAKMVEEEREELTRLREENAELKDDLAEERQRNDRMFSNQEKMQIKIKEIEVKADKWNSIPQYFCMRGDKERAEEVKAMFKDRCGWVTEWNFSNPNKIFYSPEKAIIRCIDIDELEGIMLLATQTITELPPIEEKEEIEEFYLKPTDYILIKSSSDFDSTKYPKWQLKMYSGIMPEEGYEFIPFNAETEKLIGTTNGPTKKYKFMSVKPFFNQD